MAQLLGEHISQATNYEEMAKSEHISAIELEVRKLIDTVKDISREQVPPPLLLLHVCQTQLQSQDANAKLEMLPQNIAFPCYCS